MTRLLAATGCALLWLALPAAAGEASLDLRYRLEVVDQASKPRRARAHTIRARLGYETGPWHGFSARLEGDAILAPGSERYDTPITPRADLPRINDAETHEINQAWVAYAPRSQTRLKLGRQTLFLGADTFVASARFRQNQRTYDAITLSERGLLPDTHLQYGYLWLIDNVSGEDATHGDWNTSSHFVQIDYGGLAPVDLGAYALLLDIDHLPAQSSKTFGALAGGRWEFDGTTLLARGEFAWQGDWAHNPTDLSERLLIGEAGIGRWGLWPMLGLRQQTGNGTVALQMPIGKKHGNRGWADVFNTNPAAGLLNVYGEAKLKLGQADWLGLDVAGTPFESLELVAAHHRFFDDRGATNYGHETDLRLRFKPLDGVTVSLDYADYRAAGFGVDTRKFWFSVTVKR
ncbi:MAG: hypothetical protein QGF53_07100 [Alphaproteobacteria bacterium]|nr:hypothetical protein [Alphaproteobacteria bacterium]